MYRSEALEVRTGRPRLKPRTYIQVAVRGPDGGLARHQALVLASSRQGVELQAAGRDAAADIRAGAAVRCRLRRTDDALIWSAVILAVLGPETSHFLISHPDHHHRIQARRFARLKTALAVTFRAVDPGHAPSPLPGTGLTRDLAGGGLSLVTASYLRVGQMLCVSIQLNLHCRVAAECRVVREVCPPSRGMPGAYGLAFTSISGPARDLIVRRIFQEQARQKRQAALAKGERR